MLMQQLGLAKTILMIAWLTQTIYHIVQMRRTDDWEMFVTPKGRLARALAAVWIALVIISLAGGFLHFIPLSIPLILGYSGLILFQGYSMRQKKNARASRQT